MSGKAVKEYPKETSVELNGWPASEDKSLSEILGECDYPEISAEEACAIMSKYHTGKSLSDYVRQDRDE